MRGDAGRPASRAAASHTPAADTGVLTGIGDSRVLRFHKAAILLTLGVVSPSLDLAEWAETLRRGDEGLHLRLDSPRRRGENVAAKIARRRGEAG